MAAEYATVTINLIIISCFIINAKEHCLIEYSHNTEIFIHFAGLYFTGYGISHSRDGFINYVEQVRHCEKILKHRLNLCAVLVLDQFAN